MPRPEALEISERGEGMISDRMARVLSMLYGTGREDPTELFAEVLDADGVTVSVTVDTGRTAHIERLWSHGDVAVAFSDLQNVLGEGPENDAVRSRTAVLVPNLEAVEAERWPLLVPAAVALPVAAVFSLPLGIGAIRLGALTLLRTKPRPLSGQQLDDAFALASALTTIVLDNGRPGLANGLPTPGEWQQAVVHQATGMISVQLSVSLAEALLRLRAMAFSRGQTIVELSRDVVARRMRFSESTSGPQGPEENRG
ncbi:ANTAR domain-containing protein [Streptomyces varsoviensis]|uniref:ANTAR domain-containing protein n=1 Tax=Streptomyces varsoviensis TaxID=67373 RepID=UPI0033F94CA5